MYNIFTLPLRGRKEDIKLLIREIISEFNLSYKLDKQKVKMQLKYLEDYIWPGNITQLKNFFKKMS